MGRSIAGRVRCGRSTPPPTLRRANLSLYLIPASDDTRGHGTTGMAKFWKQELQEPLQMAPHRAT